MRVTVTEAAKALGLSHSTVSRQVRQYGVALGRDRKFELDEYVRLRDSQLNLAMSGNHAGRLLGDAPAPAAFVAPAEADEPLEEEAPRRADGGPDLSYRRAKTAREAVRARIDQLELAEREGVVVNRAEVDASLDEAARRLRDSLQALSARLAGEFVSMGDAATIRARLDGAHRELLEDMANGLERDAEPAEAAAAA